MKTNHFKNCPAPICEELDCQNVVWCAGEEICSKTKGELRSRMVRINKSVLGGRFLDSSWTKKELEKSSL